MDDEEILRFDAEAKRAVDSILTLAQLILDGEKGDIIRAYLKLEELYLDEENFSRGDLSAGLTALAISKVIENQLPEID